MKSFPAVAHLLCLAAPLLVLEGCAGHKNLASNQEAPLADVAKIRSKAGEILEIRSPSGAYRKSVPTFVHLLITKPVNSCTVDPGPVTLRTYTQFGRIVNKNTFRFEAEAGHQYLLEARHVNYSYQDAGLKVLDETTGEYIAQ